MEKQNKIPDFSSTGSENVPEKFRWRTDDIYSTGEEWKKNFKNTKKNVEILKEMANDWTKSSEKMFEFLKKLTSIRIELLKLYSYSSLNSDTFLDSSKYISMKGEVKNLYVKTGEVTSSIEEDIVNLGSELIGKYINKIPALNDYSMIFRSVLDRADHILKKEASRISTMTGMFSSAPEEASTIFRNLEIPRPEIKFRDGRKINIGWQEYTDLRSEGSQEERADVFKIFWRNYHKFRYTLAALLNGSVEKDFFYARLRRYPDSLNAALSKDAIDPSVYHLLIRNVRENLSTLHRYLRIKKKVLKLKELKYSDLYAPAIKTGKEKLYSYKEAGELIRRSLKPLGNEYRKLLEAAFQKRWIDVYPCKAKISGAYSNGMVKDIHPYILMNYNGKFSSVSTLAHELGHALHSCLSNSAQPYPKAEYPIFLAEIASTFNENLLIRDFIKSEDNNFFKAKILENYLDGYRTTLFRQTLFAEFELLIHEHVEKGETLTPDFLDEEYLRLTKEYYGHDLGVVNVEEYICSEWSAIPHFFYNFYVFQYATGIIASGILANKVINREGIENYLDLLRSGYSDYPLNILKKAGVDLKDETGTKRAFMGIEKLVNEFESSVS